MKPTALNTKSDLQPVDSQRNQQVANLQAESGASLPTSPQLKPLLLKSSYRTHELAEIFGVTNGTISNWRKKGLLKGYQPFLRKGYHWHYMTRRNEDFFSRTLGKLGREIVILPRLG